VARPKLREVLTRWWRFGGGDNWFSTSSQVPWPRAFPVLTGTPVTLQTTVGLPAVGAVISLVANTTGSIPLCVYEGEPEQREKARDTWQWHRLHDQPNEEQSAFEFMQDVATSIEIAGNAYIWKAITRRPIQDEEDCQFWVIDPAIVRVAREDGRKVFKIRVSGGEETYGTKQILHIRGWTAFLGADQAPSPIALYADTFGTALGRESFEQSFFNNNAQTTIAIVVPGPITDQEGQEIADRFVLQHTGANAYRPAVVSDGGDIKPLTLPQKDAQFIESKNFAIQDICRIFGISAMGLLDPTLSKGAGDDFERLLKVDLAGRLRRIEMAFWGDRDVFPDREELFPEFLADAVLKPDIQSRYAAYKDGIQGGWLTANDIRPKENLPLHPDGDSLQITPVGGAPNPESPNGKVTEPVVP